MLKKNVRVANAILDLENSGSRSDFGQSEYGIDPLSIAGGYARSNFGPSAETIAAVKDSLDNGLLSSYPDPGAGELKAVISGYAGLPAEYIGCYPGKIRALEYISRTYLDLGSGVLSDGYLPDIIRIVAATTGSTVLEMPFDNPLSPSLEPIIDNIGRRTRILYLGNPSELLGTYFTEAELVFLLAYAENTMIVVDESYYEYSGFTVVDLVRKFPNLAVVRSFSRAFGLRGLNVSYMITDPENLRFISRLSGGDSVDGFASAAAGAALKNLDHMRNHVDAIGRSRELVSSNLPGFGYDFYLPPADFIILRVSDPLSFSETLRENGIPAEDLSGFRQLDGLIRISIGTEEETDRLLLNLGRMAEKFATGLNRNRIGEFSNSEEKSPRAGIEI